MTFVVSALAFFLLITGLIIIHELGHFYAAKLMGVEVEEFGFGLPPMIKKIFRWNGTDFTLNWIPFGGFVRLKGENATRKSERRARGSFGHASILARCFILTAGVLMNFLLAFAVYLYGFSAAQWIPTYLSLQDMQQAADRGDINLTLGVIVDDVLTGGGAAEVGVPAGAILVSIDGALIEQSEEVIALQQGKTDVEYAYRESAQGVETVIVRVPVEDGKTGVHLRTLPLDVSVPERTFIDATVLAGRETALVTKQTILGIGQLFSSIARRGQVPEGVTGIVGIAQLTHESLNEGFTVYLRLVALLSLSLAVLNILPFPALDGGRLMFVLSEIFFQPESRRFELITNTLGFGVLLMVIVIVTLYDVLRIFS